MTVSNQRGTAGVVCIRAPGEQRHPLTIVSEAKSRYPLLVLTSIGSEGLVSHGTFPRGGSTCIGNQVSMSSGEGLDARLIGR